MGLLLIRRVDSFKGVGRMVRSLMAVLAVSTPAELRQRIRFLKAENEGLRAQIRGSVRVTAAQRATLVKFARPLGKSIRQVAGIVKPETILRWIRAANKAERDAVKARRPRRRWAGRSPRSSSSRSSSASPGRRAGAPRGSRESCGSRAGWTLAAALLWSRTNPAVAVRFNGSAKHPGARGTTDL